MKNKVYQPATISEALDLTNSEKDFIFIAGGTDVIVNSKQGNAVADVMIDINGIEELKQFTVRENYLEIGTGITLGDISRDNRIAELFPALREAAISVATPVIRETATVGGNILCENRCNFYNQSEWWREAVGYCLKCNGDICIVTGGNRRCFSKFISDTAVAMIGYNAEITIVQSVGEKIIPLIDLYTGDGINLFRKEKESIIKNIILPTDKNFRSEFRKLRPRRSLDFTSLTSVVTIDSNGIIRIALGGVDPMPILITGSVNDNLDFLIQNAVKKPRVIDNDYYPRRYRKQMIEHFVSTSLNNLLKI